MNILKSFNETLERLIRAQSSYRFAERCLVLQNESASLQNDQLKSLCECYKHADNDYQKEYFFQRIKGVIE